MKKISTIIFFFAMFLIQAQQYSVLHNFNGTPDGASPQGDLLSYGGYLYGMTSEGGGGMYGYGTIFKVKPDGTDFETLMSFNGTKGKFPYGSLITDSIYLYGMTYQGGTNNQGTIFKIKFDGTGFDTLKSFYSINGYNPSGSLITDGTYLYGMTYYGGTYYSDGTIFKIKPDGSDFTTLANIPGNTTSSPISDGIYLYGTTDIGGDSYGSIFKVKPDGSDFTTIMSFDGTNGYHPYGSLMYDGTYLYGMTADGGIYGESYGNIYKIKPDGTGFDTLMSFNHTNGSSPTGSLISDGIYLYGMTLNGDVGFNGNIFKIKSDGTGFANMMTFSGTDGANPYGSLITDGNYLYGMTASGGSGYSGVIFKYCMQSMCNIGIEQFDHNNEIEIFPNPTNDVLNIVVSSSSETYRELNLTDVLGNKLNISITSFKGEKATIDISTLQSGVYFIKVGNSTQKFIKQ